MTTLGYLLDPTLNMKAKISFRDDWHIFFSCTVVSIQARQVAGLELSILNRMQQMSSAKDIILSICEGEDADTARRFAMLLWVLWNNRNNKVWNDSQEIGHNLGHQSRHLWLDWFSMQRFQQRSPPTMQQQQVLAWQKPPTGWFKCNSDAGFHNDLNKTSDGWCLRDHSSNFVQASTNWREGQCSIVEGKSLALLEAMKAMEHRGLTNVIFETDSKSVTDAIHYLHASSSEFSATI
ncbi:cytochrome p450, partial [Trifolium pratense]